MSQRTVVGIFPSEWHLMQLGDLFEAKAGGDYVPANSSDVRDNRYPYPIYANSLTQQGLYGFSNCAEEPAESITVTARGTLGQAFYRDTPFVAIGRLLVLKPKVSLDARFFCEYINYGIHFAIESTGVPQLTAPQISKHLLPVPPKNEQRAIAKTLSDVDGLLNALGALIAKKRMIKQATMQQLLTGKTRLSGFSGKWIEKPLADLALITMGQSPSSLFYNLRGEGLPLIQGNADIENRQTIERVWTAQVSKCCNLGDLILTVRAPVGAVAVASKNACIGRGVCSLRPFEDSGFLFHALIYAEDRWQTLEQGSTFTAANSEQVGQFRLCVPNDESEQRAISSVLSDMDAEIAALEQRRDKTHAIKHGMMQQLLTGQVRLVKYGTE